MLQSIPLFTLFKQRKSVLVDSRGANTDFKMIVKSECVISVWKFIAFYNLEMVTVRDTPATAVN